jgi:hypothetical protein
VNRTPTAQKKRTLRQRQRGLSDEARSMLRLLVSVLTPGQPDLPPDDPAEANRILRNWRRNLRPDTTRALTVNTTADDQRIALDELVEAGMLERVDDNRYRLTDDGAAPILPPSRAGKPERVDDDLVLAADRAAKLAYADAQYRGMPEQTALESANRAAAGVFSAADPDHPVTPSVARQRIRDRFRAWERDGVPIARLVVPGPAWTEDLRSEILMVARTTTDPARLREQVATIRDGFVVAREDGTEDAVTRRAATAWTLTVDALRDDIRRTRDHRRAGTVDGDDLDLESSRLIELDAILHDMR